MRGPLALRFGVMMAAAAALAWMYAHQGGQGILTDDGAQYIDAAASLVRGGCLCTGVAHFDEQVAYGRFPVPFTHFPPGYPLVIAALAKIGAAPTELAAALLAAGLGHLASVWLLWTLAMRLGAGVRIAAGASLLWILHAAALGLAASTSTEPLFTAVLLALAVTMVSDPSPRLLVACGLLAALSYSLRYAGLFVLPAAGAYLLWCAWKHRGLRWSAAAGLLLLVSVTLAVMLRNVALIGSWRGGFAGAARGLSPVRAVVDSAKAGYHIVFGDRAAARADLWLALLGVALLVLAWQLWRHPVSRVSGWTRGSYLRLALLGGTYATGILAASLQTIAADFNRYYLPLYPLALAAAAALCSAAMRPAASAALACAVLAILGVHSRSLTAAVGPSRMQIAERAPEARAWILAHTQPGEPLLAVNGQALRLLLGRERNVVSMIYPGFTSRVDDARGIATLFERFGARYLVLYRLQSEAEVPEQAANPFLSRLAASGATPPDGLRVAFESPQVRIVEKLR